jgi:hypothetical protein
MLSVSEEAPITLPSQRRKGTRRGAKLIFLSAVLTPIFLGLSFLFDSPIPLFIPATVFLAGLSLMLYFRLFGEDIPLTGSQQEQPAWLGTMPDNNALSPASGVGISSVGGKQVRTTELAEPRSVTEHTTRLLDVE